MILTLHITVIKLINSLSKAEKRYLRFYRPFEEILESNANEYC